MGMKERREEGQMGRKEGRRGRKKMGERKARGKGGDGEQMGNREG